MRFTINAAGGGTLTHKWQKNGADLNPLPEGVSGETTDTLQIENVARSHEGTYTCIVSNEAGPTPSNPAQLTVRKCLIQLFCGLPEIQQYSSRTDPFVFVLHIGIFLLVGWGRGGWGGI